MNFAQSFLKLIRTRLTGHKYISLTVNMSSSNQEAATKKATFALACFWSPEAKYGCAPGVLRTRVGYSGGKMKDPTYQVIGDHTETVDIDYDPKVTTYENLLQIFWAEHDPTVNRSQQYKSIIFYRDDEQKKLAEESKQERQKSISKVILTQIVPFEVFYEAEDYHQKYLLQTYHKLLLEGLNIKEGDLISSTVAARLNGYVAGYGNMQAFDAEWQSLGLSAAQAEYVRKQIKK